MEATVYEIEPRSPFLGVMSALNRENVPANTVTFMHLVDLTSVEELRARAATRSMRKPSYTAFVIKAVALGLRDFPYANRRVTPLHLLGLRIQRFTEINAAVMVERELPEAPMVAFCDVIRSADHASLAEITGQLRMLAESDATTNRQWREFKAIVERLPGWLSKWLVRMPMYSPSLWVRYRGGAFLVSSPAKYGVEAILSTWPWPLGFSFGLVARRPMILDETIVARPSFTLTLNWDRRVMAGAQAARFFRRVVEILENAGTEIGPDDSIQLSASLATK